MISVAICDDDIALTGKLETILLRIARVNLLQIDTEIFWDGLKLAKIIENGLRFDIIFLDIEMGRTDGISIARRIRESDKNVLIIYVTSHESYMQESFEVRPFRFLIKPVEQERISICFRAACEEISSGEHYFRYSYQRVNHKVLLRDILYFESNKRKINIITNKGECELYGKLNEVEKILQTSKAVFLRVHQSFLVNYKYIHGLGYDFVIMENGKQISISENRRKKISEEYCTIEDSSYGY